MQLSEEQKILHEQAINLCKQHRRVEAALVAVINAIDKTKLYKKLGQPSLFLYAVKILGLSEATAYSFISVARKSNEVVNLLAAIESQKLSVAKACRMVSVLNQNNAAELIEFATTHSTRELEYEVAKIRPRAQAPDRAKPISGDLIKLEMCVSKDVHAKLKRAQALVSSKVGKNVGFEEILDAVLTDFLNRHDPVKKAERATAKKIARDLRDNSVKGSLESLVTVGATGHSPEPFDEVFAQLFDPTADELVINSVSELPQKPAELCARRVSEQKPTPRQPPALKPRTRQPLTAAEKHAVFARDGGRCTHIDATGRRCNSDRWLHLHHLTPVSQGGRNEPHNLTTLCSFHHDLVHQLSFTIEGQVTWLREKRAHYRASV